MGKEEDKQNHWKKAPTWCLTQSPTLDERRRLQGHLSGKGDRKSPLCSLNMLAGRWSMGHGSITNVPVAPRFLEVLGGHYFSGILRVATLCIYCQRVYLSLIETSRNFVQNVDYVDIDQVPNVPDTPARLAAQDVNGRQVVEIGSDSSTGNTDFSGEVAKNQLRARSKLALDNGHRKSLLFRPGKNVSISNKSEVDGDFKVKALSTTQSPNRGRNGVVDLMEWRGPAQVFHNDVPNAVLEDCFQAKEFRKGSIPTNGFSSLCGMSNSSATAVNNTCRGKEKVNDTCKGGSGLDRGKGTFGDSLPEVGNGVSSPFYSSPSPRNDRGTPSNSSLNLVRDLIAGGNNVDLGVIFQPSSSEEPAAKTIDLATRSSIAHNEQICGPCDASGDAFRCFEGFGGCTKKHTSSQGSKHSYEKTEARLYLKYNHGQSSTSAAVDSEFVIPSSSMEPLNSRSTRNHSDSGPRILDPDHLVIEVDIFSPEVRHYGSDYRDASSNDVTSSFRHLIPLSCEWLFSFMQFNALITSARQREESSQHSYSGGSHPVFHPSDSLTSNSYRQSWSPFSQNPSMYGGTNAQGPASARLTRVGVAFMIGWFGSIKFGIFLAGELDKNLKKMMVELSRREKQANIKPDPEIDIFMKILDLEMCTDTLVGAEMRTGIYGGQKKWLTTGEMLVGPSDVISYNFDLVSDAGLIGVRVLSTLFPPCKLDHTTEAERADEVPEYLQLQVFSNSFDEKVYPYNCKGLASKLRVSKLMEEADYTQSKSSFHVTC
ncbi:hypothetical protein RHMOL_Rhmol02G0158300 [Rhododendron molle]|uniref:Uncharacterized protein n=1 Tax=Rhododendron molle TaxID=49168 RepID=A0ACC0PQZ6_RHOML|nr:hypothetical protein RHMOL_Rhmol02G0158300 [Rhododendron molle]